MKNVSPPVPDRLGAHVSVAGGVSSAPGRAAALPAKAFQIFTRNQNQWQAKPLVTEEVTAWFDQLDRYGISPKHVCTHDSYLINLAAVETGTLNRSRHAFVDEIRRCALLGVPHLVFHPGSHLGKGETAGIAAVARNLDRCIEEAGSGPVPDTEKVMLCLETTAGQGTNLGHRCEHLRDMIAASRYPDRLAVCLDTCHVFAAGYRLDTPHHLRKTLRAFDTAIGLGRIVVMHLNDSQREGGSRVDRHARIGQGMIGTEPFRTLLRTRRLQHAIKVLEVPGGEDAYREDLALLRSLLKK